MPENEERTETRAVRVEDPSLPDGLNQELTDELQEVIGADEVEVPASTPHGERHVRDLESGQRGWFGRNRLLIAIVGIAAIVVGAIIALATDKWWIIFIPVGVHFVATMVIGAVVINMTTQPEALDPSLAARLEDAGVPAPEQAFNDLVEEYTSASGDAGDVIAQGDNDDDHRAGTEPGKAARQQQTAMTPAEGATESAGDDSSAVFTFQYVIVGSLALLSIIGAFLVENGWILPLVMIPLCAAWGGYQAVAQRRAGD